MIVIGDYDTKLVSQANINPLIPKKSSSANIILMFHWIYYLSIIESWKLNIKFSTY